MTDDARKNDGDKLRYDLIPADALEQVADLFTLGARKYGDRNWEQGFNYTRVYAAMMRHLQAWYMGEDYDSEDGQHHLAPVAWGALVLLHFQLSGPTMDDRPIGPPGSGDTASGLSTPR
ncbi:hypothetical protein LCGC14_0446390 [marine sediment metagenome]|uniref:dATP/dGTP diphosphohydrolase N-terminal domain-containing protein n=1 Tax=marine sediment metagenome TaxID=412755 RepID=A0A0F9SPW7_9ZZZZ